MAIDLNPVVSLAANFAVFYGTLTRRRRPATHIFVMAVFVLLGIAGFALPLGSGLFGILLRYVVSLSFFLPVLFLFRESPAEKAFLFFMSWGLSSFFRSLGLWIAFWLAPLGPPFVVASVFFICCYSLLLYLYFRYLRNRLREILALFDKGRPAYAIFPFMAFALFVALFGPERKPGSLHTFALMLLFECLIILMYYILFSHFYAVYNRQKAETALVGAERQLILQKRCFGEIEKGREGQDRLLRDTRDHFVTIAALAQRGDPAAISAYVKALLDSRVDGDTRRYCENKVANAVIGDYIELAEKQGIMVSFDLDLPEAICIDKYELCVLFGNSIENALESCLRIPHDSPLFARRFIEIKAWTEAGRLVVRIENSCDRVDVNGEGEYSSVKGSPRGVGLESVRTVVDEYRGCLSCESREDVFVLSAILYPRRD